ncbi:MAG: hypothetical protein AAFX87_23290 [Bacteroidota bacterium]
MKSILKASLVLVFGCSILIGCQQKKDLATRMSEEICECSLNNYADTLGYLAVYNNCFLENLEQHNDELKEKYGDNLLAAKMKVTQEITTKVMNDCSIFREKFGGVMPLPKNDK